MRGDKVWSEDVGVLWKRPAEFFPTADQTSEERVNAFVRLVVYASLASFAYNRQTRSLVLGGAAVAVITVAFRGGSEKFPVARNADPVQTAQARADRCTPPTKDNPFANVLLSDLAQSPDRPPACAYDSVKDEIRTHFNDGLMRNSLDVYQVENSQRQFYTMPVTDGIPDTGAFANFLYSNMKSCKSDQTACGNGAGHLGNGGR